MAETPSSSPETAATPPVPEAAGEGAQVSSAPAPELETSAAAAAEPEALASEPLAQEPVPAPEPFVEPAPEPIRVAEAVPAPEPVPATAAPSLEPEAAPMGSASQPALEGVAATISVPPLAATPEGEGGEWDILTGKVRAWLDGAQLQERWNALGGPLRSLGLLLAALVVLRLYGALLDTLGDLPLVPRLLQLVGVIALVRFALTRLVRSSDRERILGSWRQRWDDFRGRS